jgi:hypothetical protein
MIKALGGEELSYKIAGGTKWWQVRAGGGVEGEWIVLKRDWRDYNKKRSEEIAKGNTREKEREKINGGGMVGEDGGVGENGECESLFIVAFG